MGHLMTRLGKDYSHEGVAELFTNIYNSGYKLVYLTARPLSQMSLTRDYIKAIKQGKYVMPNAPIITSADRVSFIFKMLIVARVCFCERSGCEKTRFVQNTNFRCHQEFISNFRSYLRRFWES
jgi:hypothetical protein